MKSTDGGQTWAWLSTTDGNPIYGLSCPTTTVCYATDIYAHVVKTTDGGATWAWQTTPITTPGVAGRRDPAARTRSRGLTGDLVLRRRARASPSASTSSSTGQTIPSTDPPIVTTTDGGATWTRQASGAGTGNYLHADLVPPGHDHVLRRSAAAARSSRRPTSTTWTPQTSGTTSLLNSVAAA